MTRKVVLDTDPGCDDAVAIALALASDQLDVVGLTTVAGNTTVENATRNALAVLELFDRTDVPVASGCGQPLAHDLETAEEIHGSGGMAGDVPDPTTDPIDAHAAEFLRELADEYGEDLTIVGIGPLTNVATAMAVDPTLPERIGDLVVMGGVVRATGNRTPMAEANFYSDPTAARRVVRDAAPRLIGLNVTHEAEVPASIVEGDGRRERALTAWLEYYPGWVREAFDLEHSPQHDAVAVASLLDDVVAYGEAATDVVVSDGDCRGAVVYDEYGVTERDRTARVAVNIDVDRFRTLLGDGLAELTA